MHKTKIINRIVSVIGLALGAFALSALAGSWTAPTQAPPSGNADAPLNVGALAQHKEGTLAIGKTSDALTGLKLDVNGLIGSTGLFTTGDLYVNGVSSTTQLKVTGGSPAIGKVLTSDASGNATWQAVTSSGPVFIAPSTAITFTDLTASTGWVSYDASSAIPTTAKAVILEAEAIMSGPNGLVTVDLSNPELGNYTGKILIKKDTVSTTPSLLLLSLAAAGSGDFVAGSNQAIFPVTNGTFGYMIKPPTGISTSDHFSGRIRIVGYYP